MKTRTFSKLVAVAAQEIVQVERRELVDYLRNRLEADFEEERGPRGGRYVAAGPISKMRSFQTHDDWMRNITSFEIERPMRYVRPKR